MRVLLINPPANIVADRSEIKFCCPPLGLMSLASSLMEASSSFEVKILDTLIGSGYTNESIREDGYIRYGITENQIADEVRSFSPDVVGISGVHSNRIFEVRETTRAVKSVSKDIVTIVGGGFASLNSKECLDDENCDFIVIGEGEKTLIELLSDGFYKLGEVNVKGVGYKKDGEIIINPAREPIKELDAMPRPAYHLVDLEEYFKIDMKGARYGKKRYMLFCGSRGCPYSCHYCAKPLLVGEGYRERSVKNMVDEIFYLKDNFDIKEIRFVDYHAMANIKRWKQFCQELIDRKVDIEFSDPHGMAIQSLDEEMLELMRKAGCKRLYISIESGDQKYLDTLKKGVKLSKVELIVNKARELNYYITGYFIIGIPGQKWKDIKGTVDYAKSLDLDDVDFFIANAFPGAPLYFECLKNDTLSNNYHPKRLKYGLSNLRSDEYTAQEIEEYRRKAWFDFMLDKAKRRKVNSHE